MTPKEQRISETLARLIPALTDGQKDCFLAYAEGMAAVLGITTDARANRPEA